MTTDFEKYNDLYPGAGTGADIRAAVDDPVKHASNLQIIAGDLNTDSTVAGGQVTGTPAPVAKNPAEAGTTLTELSKNGYYAAGLINRFASDVETFDGAVTTLNTKLHEAPAEKRSDKKKELQPQWNSAFTTLEAGAEAAGDDFSAGPNAAVAKQLILAGHMPLAAAANWPSITFTEAERKQAQQNEFKLMSPDQQVTYIREHPEIPFDVVAIISPEAAETLAQQVAGDIEGKEIDEETARILGLLATAPSFTTPLFTQVSPDEWGDAITELNKQLFGIGNDHPEMGSKLPMQGDVPDLSVYDKFMNAAGIALATHSNTTSDPDGLAQEWYDAITDSDNPENAGALTLMIREGGEQAAGNFDATFIDHLSTDLLDWERSDDFPGWGERAREAGVWVRDPDRVELNGYVDGYGDQVYSVNGGIATDGLANMLAGMGHSPEGAQRFFMNSDGTVDEDTLGYLMLDRKFAEDWSTGGTHTYSDNGDGLGEALQAATIGGDEDKNGDYTQAEADTLANKIFDVIVNNSGTNDSDDLDVNKSWDDRSTVGDTSVTDEWHIWAGMTDSIGAIATGYSEDIYQVLATGVGDYDGDNPTRLDLDVEGLHRLIGEIGHTSDKTGLETLLAGVSNAGIRAEVSPLVSPYSSLTEFNNGNGQLDTSNLGLVLGDIVNHSTDVQEDEEMTDQTRAMYVAKAIEFGSSLLPGTGKILGEGANDLLVAGIDYGRGQAISALQDAIQEAPEPGPPGDMSSSEYNTYARGAVRDSLQYALANEFLAQGLLGQQPNGQGYDEATFPGVDPSITVPGPNGTPVFDPDLFFHRAEVDDPRSAAWNSWTGSRVEDIVGDHTQEATNELDAILNLN